MKKIAARFSHRNGLDILESPRYQTVFQEFVDVLSKLPPYRAANTKKTSSAHVIAPAAMNQWLDNELCVMRDWDWHPLIIEEDRDDPEHRSQLRSDYRKNGIEVEFQFGNVARYAYDVYKMAIAPALGRANVGIQVVCSRRFAAITGGNIAYFERVVRELERSRLTLIVPLAVIGIEPEQWIIDAFPSEGEAPKVTRNTVNAALRARGKPPIPPEAEVIGSLSTRKLRRLAARVAA